MAGIRSRAKAARSLAQDMAELSRPARHPLLPDWPQNLRQPRPPSIPSSTATASVQRTPPLAPVKKIFAVGYAEYVLQHI